MSTVDSVTNNTVSTVGNLTHRALRSGQVLDLARSGLSTVSETVNAAGNTVRRLCVRNGQLYEVVIDTSNRILSSRKVES